MHLCLALALLALAACGTPMQTTDAAPMDASSEAATADGAAAALNATEQALVGTWTRERPETSSEGFRWSLVLRADRSSELTYSVIQTGTGCVREFVVATRTWRATADGATLTFGAPSRGPTMDGPCGPSVTGLGATIDVEIAAGDYALAVAGASMTTRPAAQPASANVTWTRQ